MPAIAAIVREAVRSPDPRDLLIEIETAHERITNAAATLLAGAASVVTISNNSLVERVVGRARPDRIVLGVHFWWGGPGKNIPSLVDPDCECVKLAANQTLAEPPAGETVPGERLCTEGYYPRRRGSAEYQLRGKEVITRLTAKPNPEPPPERRFKDS